MSKYEYSSFDDIDHLINKIEDGILIGTTTLADSSDFFGNNARCSVRVYERWSVTGSNRVSLNVTIFVSEDGAIQLSAITSGGSRGAFIKLNTLGEDAFLDKLKEILQG